jgi:hypothetical protein
MRRLGEGERSLRTDEGGFARPTMFLNDPAAPAIALRRADSILNWRRIAAPRRENLACDTGF